MVSGECLVVSGADAADSLMLLNQDQDQLADLHSALVSSPFVVKPNSGQFVY